jgi:hypothetical protein
LTYEAEAEEEQAEPKKDQEAANVLMAPISSKRDGDRIRESPGKKFASRIEEKYRNMKATAAASNLKVGARNLPI